MVGKSEQVVLRLEPELMALADEVTELASKLAGVDTPRAGVIRTAMRRGLEEMRAELKSKLGKRK